jgi:hypothetical protein
MMTKRIDGTFKLLLREVCGALLAAWFGNSDRPH